MATDVLEGNPLTAIINKLSETVYWMDKEGRIIDCNDLQAKLFGLNTAEELKGKNIFDVAALLNWPDAIPKEIRKNDLQIMLQAKQRQIIEETVILNGKERIFLSIKEPWINSNKQVLGIIGSALDITERKQAEIAKREFIQNMEHDLRTPFSGVYGLASILHKEATDPKQKEYLGYILTSSEQWMAIVDQILSVSSVEKNVLTPTHFDIQDVVDEVCKFLIAKIKLKNLDLIIDCPSKIIHCDRLRIHRILLNLVSNAVKFTETGKITLTVAVDEQLKIIVEDTGCGIPEDKLEFIFEKFTKLSPSNKYADKFQGSGLGLYVSKYYVNELKGTITVESTLDHGSRFIVSIPKM